MRAIGSDGLGGDEFIILFRNVDGKGDLSGRCSAALAALCQPLVIGRAVVPVAASIGHALFPQDGDDIESLLKNADKALYAAKRGGIRARTELRVGKAA